MFNSPTDGIMLNPNAVMPCIGYGTYQTPDGKECVDGVVSAIMAGYRHIDTAQVYENEKSVGIGIKASGIDRKEIFLTSKVWNTHHGYDNTMRAFHQSIKKLDTNYLDLYLIHWPIAKSFSEFYPSVMIDTYRALENLYENGLVKAIGVSNFLPHHLKTLLDNCKIKPMVDQMENHVGLYQKEAVEFCRENGITVEAWSPVCKGRAFQIEAVRNVAEKHRKTPAQVLIRWCLEKELVPLPKSVTPNRIKENIQVFDFSLDCEDMAKLDAVTEIGRLGSHPDNCKF